MYFRPAIWIFLTMMEVASPIVTDRKTRKTPYLPAKYRKTRALGGESNDFLDNLQDQRKRRNWKFMHLIIEGSYFKFPPPGQGFLPGDVLTGYNNIVNTRSQNVGTSTQTCILTTNWVCTWTIFSASITKSGCDIMAQGYFIRGDIQTFGVPVEQFVAITGGTGPCRGIIGEIKISPRRLENPPPLWDYELYYRIDD